MTAFKLLAIRPLQDCHPRFIKNLSPGLIYQFYQNFDFLNENNNAVKQAENVFKIKTSQAIPENLYDVKSADGTELKISISAIAGKNGSGKSSLIELLFAIVYVFSVEHRLLETELTSPDTAGNLRNDIRSFQIRLLELWAKKNEDYEELKTKHSGDIPFEALEKEFTLGKEEKYLNSRLKQLQKDLKNLPDRLENLTNFKDQLRAELYFEVDGKYFQIKCDPGNSLSATGSIWAIGDDGTRPVMVHLNEAKEHLQRLIFYTISVNYSHHSLNSLVIGEWINSLFHKNDGYRTPLVINPMRTKGNFDINREMSLVKYRLLSNLLVQKYHDSEKPLWVTDNQIVEKIVFRLNMGKVANLEASLNSEGVSITGNPRAARMISDLISLIDDTLPMATGLYQDMPLKDVLLNYIVGKADRISELYPGFEHGYQFGPNAPMLDSLNYLKSLIEDGTHITNKLLQALNFLRYILLNGWDNLRSNYLSDDLDINGQITLVFEPEKLIDWMKLKNAGEIAQKIPPSIFEIDFILASPKTTEKSSFADLSSGEQHLIYVIQSVIYHINNLQSVHFSKKPRLTYNSVNIIYDEIELYFHPEFQRRLINDLLQAFKNLYLAGKTGIRAINIQLLTHSPFLLSDIPDNNILLLDFSEENGKSITKEATKTFAANINDLLADNFFLEDTLMGKFAEQQINNLIDKIKNNVPLNDDDELLIENIGDDYLRVSILEFIKANG